MNWQDIVISIVSIVVTTLIGWGLAQLKTFINNKVKNTKYAEYLTRALDLVANGVKVTYQTYVEDLKGKDAFTKEAQEEALAKAKETIVSQMSCEVKDYISSTFGDFDQWLVSHIESTLYDLKNKADK